MKLRIPLILTLTLLSLTVAYDNPLIPTFISELVITPGGNWTMEMLFSSGRTLDGWGLASKGDTAYFKTGIAVGTGFFVFTKDSLQEPLAFSRIAERILVLTPFGEGGTLTFGSMPNSVLTTPRFGQSISLNLAEGFYYLDNTATLGFENDTLNAMGDIAGLVTDTLGIPLSGVHVTYHDWMGRLEVADSLGKFHIHDFAKQQQLWFSLPGYNTRQFVAQMYPDSTVALTVKMTIVLSSYEYRITSPEKVQLLSYPNPFNPTTAIRYELPRAMEVHLTVFDMQGRSVAVLASGRKEAGVHQTTFDGSALPSGIYFCRLLAEKFRGTNKLVLLR
jgi:hypothetical protein